MPSKEIMDKVVGEVKKIEQKLHYKKQRKENAWDRILANKDPRWKEHKFTFEHPLKLRSYKLEPDRAIPLPSPLYIVMDGVKIRVN